MPTLDELARLVVPPNRYRSLGVDRLFALLIGHDGVPAGWRMMEEPLLDAATRVGQAEAVPFQEFGNFVHRCIVAGTG